MTQFELVAFSMFIQIPLKTKHLMKKILRAVCFSKIARHETTHRISNEPYANRK